MIKLFYITLLSIISYINLNSSLYAATDIATERPAHWATLISSQHNFYQISPFLFRSEQPAQNLIPLLQYYQINTVINLRSSDKKDQQAFKNTSVELVHIPIHTWAISKQDLLQIMQVIQTAKQQQKNVLIHCYHGSDRTGASIAMYRIIFEHWSIEDALNEMQNGGYGFHPIWFNIKKLFTPENIQWIQQQLQHPV
ncbi:MULTISPECIES: dual specificity protein phosphatase family protein [unclassified Acinetobacter]|uniref:dual specificity protein phosphatase family protein n=1 Tax=unclassified Acinetobacter TaxID=196816 RepID=UPI0029344EED|nr:MULTISPECIES: dual specificity protein phosphatase family protein [unclassified Acinetobacter]WOE30467.1 dual specificity protein phosphatase family protein [Acinetobacter sp. SAAs470]WOE38658.1 dual specificity protein phosphatase family protein [Acinetobacter sp. SAAs474]